MDLGWKIGQLFMILFVLSALKSLIDWSEFKETVADFFAGMTAKSLLTTLLGAACLYAFLFAAAL